MNISQKGIDLIKKYEGLRLTAYKPVSTEKYWTIGYGHYGADVKPGMVITQAQAEAYLRNDCASSVKAVNAIGLNFNQNQFDALVSFAYNCGTGNLKTLCKNRTVDQIGDKITAYNKAGGKVLAGLVRRREEEQKLYKSGSTVKALPTIKYGSTGQYVKEAQLLLNAKGYNCGNADGIFGNNTKAAVKKFQLTHPPLDVDGIIGKMTWAELYK